MQHIKNIDAAKAVELASLVEVSPHKVISRTLAQNPALNMTLFAFDGGEEISSHKSDGDAFVYVLEGEGDFTIDGQKYRVKAGQSIVMPAGLPHAIFAPVPFKWFLVVVF